MVKVLQFVYKMQLAGAETLLMQIYRAIDRNKVQFDFVTHTDETGNYDNEIRDLGGKIFHMPVLPRENFLLYVAALRKIVLQNGPYVCVHSHLLFLNGLVLEVARSIDVPLRVSHAHSTNDGKGNSVDRLVYRWLMRHKIRKFATHMFAASRPAGEWVYGRNCWQDSRSQLLPNAIDLRPFKALSENKLDLRKELGLPTNKMLVGHVGRLIRTKNHQKILAVFNHIVKLQPSAHLILVGEGPLEAEIHALINLLGLQAQVSMLGVRNDIPKLLGALDLFLFPSFYEGLGIVLIEAQAAGVPCIVSNTVPSEGDLGLGLVKFLPLSAGCDVWSRVALKSIKSPRMSWSIREQGLRQNHYDILELAPKMQEFYCGESNSFNW